MEKNIYDKEKKNEIVEKNNLKYVILFVVFFFTIVFVGIILYMLKNINPATTNIFPPCFVYKLTGFKCAGCGATRAIHQILNLNFKEAIVLNPLIFVYFIFIIYLIIRIIILKVQKKNIKNILKKEITIILYILLAITVVFMILRNILI